MSQAYSDAQPRYIIERHNGLSKRQQALVEQVQQGLRSAQVRSHCQSLHIAVGSLASVLFVNRDQQAVSCFLACCTSAVLH